MAGRVVAGVGTFVFIWIAPGTVAGLIPYALTRWQMKQPLLGISAGRIVGGALVGLGVAVVVDCFVRFAVRGRGTPAPIVPTEILVVTGLYRYVRNPMYVGVLAALLGQGLLLGSRTLLGYAGLLWLLFHAFIVLYEEPTLKQQFGSSYDVYRSGVRRWWPRVTSWRDSAG